MKHSVSILLCCLCLGGCDRANKATQVPDGNNDSLGAVGDNFELVPIKAYAGTDLSRTIGLQLKRTDGSQRYEFHAPHDRENAASMGTLFFDQMVSPNRQWVALPAGRFDGFLFLPTGALNGDLEKLKLPFLHLESKPGQPAKPVKFVRWNDEESVVLTVLDDSPEATNLHEFVVPLTHTERAAKIPPSEIIAGQWTTITFGDVFTPSQS